MSNFSDFFGGGSGGIPQQRSFITSGTFTAPVTGKYLLTAIGGGAAGTSEGRGGGAGGFAQKPVTLAAGDVITFSVGAGGASSGATGGTTTLTAPGVSLSAGGGTSTAGGSATGGSLNTTGGVSGNSNGSGGGAVGVYGVGYGSAASMNSGGGGVGEASTTNPGGGALGKGYKLAGPAFGAGRLLQPLGEIGGDGVVGAEGRPGGLFSGGGGGRSGGAGGVFGGGGGGSVQFNEGPGGVGGVFIEWQV